MSTQNRPAASLAKWDFQDQFVNVGSTGSRTAPPGEGYKFLFQSTDIEPAVSERQQNANKMAKVKSKVWDTATSPIRTIGMNLAMIALNKYLMGGGVGIMALGMVFFSWTMFTSSLKLLFGVQKAFARFEGTNNTYLLPAKCVYLLLCAAGAAYQFWDLKSMGLFPVHSGDYVSYIPEKRVIETSVGFLSY